MQRSCGTGLRSLVAKYSQHGCRLTRPSVCSCAVVGVKIPFAQQPQQQPQFGQQQGVRYFVSQHTSEKREHLRSKRKQQGDPFAVLGLSENVEYPQVKKAFLHIAMKHHPDTSGASSEKEKEQSRDVFLKARKAFEQITEGPGGKAILKSDADSAWEEEELNEWFQQESGGFDMPFMDVNTRKEVSRVMDEIGGGLDRDGGMWTLARMVANDVKSGGDGASLLRLEAGEARDRSIDGILRRKRKR